MSTGNRTGGVSARPKTSLEKNWGLHEYDELLAGMHDPGALRQVDGRGMTPTIAAVLDTGSMAHRLMSLLDEPGTTEEESSLDRLVALLEESLEVQKASSQKLDALLRVLAPFLSRAMGIAPGLEPGPYGAERDAG